MLLGSASFYAEGHRRQWLFPEYMLAIKRYRITVADFVNKGDSGRLPGSNEARQPLRVAADPIFYCPTGLFTGISPDLPHCTWTTWLLLLCTTYQTPVDGRHTAKSALRSPS